MLTIAENFGILEMTSIADATRRVFVGWRHF